LPLSGLQHLLFCSRRAALVHLEQAWNENRTTAEGKILHERVHQGGDEARGAVRIARGLRLVSRRLGIAGQADVVEFHRIADGDGAVLPGVTGRWTPYPIEYKRGRLRDEPGYDVQLCAQAVCLEEMLGVAVPAGAVFYGLSRRRQDVVFGHALRAATADAARRLHDLFDAGVTPVPEYGPKCRQCSLVDVCRPAAAGRSARRYVEAALEGGPRPECA
jgi:CRISPR-associated exonuclease Cas4